MREEEQSQGAVGPAEELKDAGAPRLRVMSGSNWEKERDRICERHMALFRRIEALEGGEKETGQLKRTIQHSAKKKAHRDLKQNKQNKQNKTNNL